MSESLGKRIHGLRGAARLTAIGEIVSGWRASGTGRAAFCREVGIVPVTLGCRWIGRLDAANGDQNAGPVIVELDAPRRRVNEIEHQQSRAGGSLHCSAFEHADDS